MNPKQGENFLFHSSLNIMRDINPENHKKRQRIDDFLTNVTLMKEKRPDPSGAGKARAKRRKGVHAP
ncbi:hypothetical protein BACCAP_01403 [Pseudoflavonifractor capillosus ATCC 29799]|uniref:Uncharacterized protein n=1 Tax=Pseudoflavonifractor capillosus ATCC 29799 TaxID=411467 RepID=A6NT74_9FIRM|nr:hypothetical protein BACCAP_01403 [Pseudoflavonifractor capillosus ATCC 29799]